MSQGSVLAGFCMLYILMQTFAVPGTLSLSLLAGALFGVLKGLLLVSGKHTARYHLLPIHCRRPSKRA